MAVPTQKGPGRPPAMVWGATDQPLGAGHATSQLQQKLTPGWNQDNIIHEIQSGHRKRH